MSQFSLKFDLSQTDLILPHKFYSPSSFPTVMLFYSFWRLSHKSGYLPFPIPLTCHHLLWILPLNISQLYLLFSTFTKFILPSSHLNYCHSILTSPTTSNGKLIHYFLRWEGIFFSQRILLWKTKGLESSSVRFLLGATLFSIYTSQHYILPIQLALCICGFASMDWTKKKI